MNLMLTNKGILTTSGINDFYFEADRSVYEVIRIINSIPLFLEDHFARLIKSVEISGWTFTMSFNDFRKKIEELTRLCDKQNGNVKFSFSVEKGTEFWAFTFIPHYYPTPGDYRKGVQVGLLFEERENPNAKVIQQSVRAKANQMIAEQQLYEVLLVDTNGQITEGSRSNVFFVKNNVFCTAPASQILVGITRSKIFDCLKALNYQILEHAVAFTEINQFDGAFLTGTSPKVLPIHSIGATMFKVGIPVVNQLLDRYNEMIGQYLLLSK